MTEEDKILISLISEKAEQCLDRQMITQTRFLDMHEKSVASGIRLPGGVKRVFYSGFEDAERYLAVFLPGYIEADDEKSLADYFASSPDDCPVAVLEVTKDKFSKALTHRDYLGALMGLGINRDTVGDIKVGENGCHIAVIKSMAEYISRNLTSAGRGTLNIRILPPGEADSVPAAQGVPDSFTVSSPRLDSIVKNGFSVSRDAACEAITRGLVFVNDIECFKPDRKINEGDKITFRHKGRIFIESFPGKSRKGKEIVSIIRYTN